jgi:hypothetical protein
VSAALNERTGISAADLPAIPLQVSKVGADGAVASEAEEIQVQAERTFWRDALVGAVIGMVVCAGIWMLIVGIALVGAGWSLGGPLLMAAGVGLFGGAFLGGWAGVMVGTTRLEAAERELLTRRHT